MPVKSLKLVQSFKLKSEKTEISILQENSQVLKVSFKNFSVAIENQDRNE